MESYPKAIHILPDIGVRIGYPKNSGESECPVHERRHQSGGDGLLKDDFLIKIILIKVMTKEGGVKNPRMHIRNHFCTVIS